MSQVVRFRCLSWPILCLNRLKLMLSYSQHVTLHYTLLTVPPTAQYTFSTHLKVSLAANLRLKKARISKKRRAAARNKLFSFKSIEWKPFKSKYEIFNSLIIFPLKAQLISRKLTSRNHDELSCFKRNLTSGLIDSFHPNDNLLCLPLLRVVWTEFPCSSHYQNGCN